MKRNLFHLFLAIGLLYSCSKPKPPKADPPPGNNTGGNTVTVPPVDTTKVVDSACMLTPPLHPSNSGMSPYLYTKQPPLGYLLPRFNPMNADEIIYVLADHSNNDKATLVKYNMVNKTKITLASNIREQADWSKKGWILFNHGDNTIWKIKDNGDSLTQLTTFFSFSAIWDKPGNRFACHAFQRSYIANENGAILDTLFLGVYRGAWSPDNSKIASEITYGKPGYIDLSNKQKQEFSGNGAHTVTGLDWSPDSQTMIWCSDNGGIYKTNIFRETTTQLRKDCAKKTYMWPSVSSDGSKIIVQAFERNAIVDTFFIESNLYIMDADGSNEHKVIID